MNLNLEGIIPLAAGVWVSLMGYGLVAIKSEAFKQKWQSHLKWLGPLVAVFGLLMLLRIIPGSG